MPRPAQHVAKHRPCIARLFSSQDRFNSSWRPYTNFDWEDVAVHKGEALFACLIIRIFQLVFSAKIIFFSHDKSANSTFSHDFSAKRTGSRSGRYVQHTKGWFRSLASSSPAGSSHPISSTTEKKIQEQIDIVLPLWVAPPVVLAATASGARSVETE
jgi:hypothetical protein